MHFLNGAYRRFPKETLKYSFTPMPVGVGVKEAFAANHEVIRGFLSKSDRTLSLKVNINE